MAATKDCPSCDAEVPRSASRCKSCFHDFAVKKAGFSIWIPVGIMGMLAAMSTMAALTLFVVTQQPIESYVQVDQETQSVVYITKYRGDSLDTKRLLWADISRLEHTITPAGKNEIAAYTLTGERWIIHEATEKPLAQQARAYEQLMGKPMVTVDNTRGFGNRDKKDGK